MTTSHRAPPMRRLTFLLLLPTAISAQSADLVLRNTTVYTVNAKAPLAQAVAVKDGKIVYVGSDAGVAKFVGPSTRALDLKGRFVFPGFVDAHAHFTGIGEREMTLNLEGTRTKAAFLARVDSAVKRAKPGAWVTGRGWIETFWSPPVFPTRQDLDRIAPNNPVVLDRADGHASIANSMALQAARRHQQDARAERRGDQHGSRWRTDRDADRSRPGAGAGDRAAGTGEDELERALTRCRPRALPRLDPGAGCARDSWAEVERMRKLYREGKLKIRLYKTISGPGADADSLHRPRAGPTGVQRPLPGSRHQAGDGRRPRLTGCGAARTLQRRRHQCRPDHDRHVPPRTMMRAGAQGRPPGRDPCHRRSWQPADPQHVRRGAQGGPGGRAQDRRSALARRTLPDRQPGRHAPLQAARHHSVDAALARHRRPLLRAEPARPRADQGGVRLEDLPRPGASRCRAVPTRRWSGANR